MKHERKDYDVIQAPQDMIPEDEPVFLLRAKDVTAPGVVEYWAKVAADFGAKNDIIEAAMRQAQSMRRWQDDHDAQVPDAPEEAFEEPERAER